MLWISKKLFGPEAVFRTSYKIKKPTVEFVSWRICSGHIKGSVNIPLQNVGSKASALAKKQPVIVCCASGMRRVKRILKSKE